MYEKVVGHSMVIQWSFNRSSIVLQSSIHWLFIFFVLCPPPSALRSSLSALRFLILVILVIFNFSHFLRPSFSPSHLRFPPPRPMLLQRSVIPPHKFIPFDLCFKSFFKVINIFHLLWSPGQFGKRSHSWE